MKYWVNLNKSMNLIKFKALLNFLEEKIKYSTLSSKDRIIALNKTQRGCKSCNLCRETKYQSVPAVINEGSKIVFIGRSPNKTEAEHNYMFPQGTNLRKILDWYLITLDLKFQECSFLNMVYHYTEGNRPPEQEIINQCAMFKPLELDIIKPSVIFLMGNDAMRFLHGMNSVSVYKALGNYYLKDNVLYVPLIHPSNLLLNPSLKEDTEAVLKSIKPIMHKHLGNI